MIFQQKHPGSAWNITNETSRFLKITEAYEKLLEVNYYIELLYKTDYLAENEYQSSRSDSHELIKIISDFLGLQEVKNENL